ncbi:glycerophosphodiester phosphodiesterase family protein [Kangiella shandongensis]|uniref:glycerophosphodiester phosphodiesterase family protein n=1 Tax=Kangiella shandongensis TaxID=2763258 RepID=UPI001CBF7398|nr:glycerophosphodiester phosphodiesterase family protein [Kangiella shandongensis]
MKLCHLFLFAATVLSAYPATAKKDVSSRHKDKSSVELGPRPFYLLNDMDDGPLKRRLQACAAKKRHYKSSEFSIGHRGAPLQFPEHTRESYVAAAQMGAGVLECDVTFTSDKELVCRHSQCDLHTTTNILGTALASKCSQPFIPADPTTGTPAQARCCTSDITLQEFKSLEGKMDAYNPHATTAEDYMQGTANWRTDLYASTGTLMTHAESIELFKTLGVKFTPELKTPQVTMPYQGMSQQDYAQKMIDEYKRAGVKLKDIYPQSFNRADVEYWITSEPQLADSTVYLDDRMDTDPNYVPSLIDMFALRVTGIEIVAPPLWALVTLDDDNNIVPSDYALYAKQAGLKIITWTLERSGPLQTGGGWYYQTVTDAVDNDGDMLVLLDVLAQDVGVMGVFSDWPATTTFYANCAGR